MEVQGRFLSPQSIGMRRSSSRLIAHDPGTRIRPIATYPQRRRGRLHALVVLHSKGMIAVATLGRHHRRPLLPRRHLPHHRRRPPAGRAVTQSAAPGTSQMGCAVVVHGATNSSCTANAIATAPGSFLRLAILLRHQPGGRRGGRPDSQQHHRQPHRPHRTVTHHGRAAPGTSQAGCAAVVHGATNSSCTANAIAAVPGLRCRLRPHLKPNRRPRPLAMALPPSTFCGRLETVTWPGSAPSATTPTAPRPPWRSGCPTPLLARSPTTTGHRAASTRLATSATSSISTGRAMRAPATPIGPRSAPGPPPLQTPALPCRLPRRPPPQRPPPRRPPLRRPPAARQPPPPHRQVAHAAASIGWTPRHGAAPRVRTLRTARAARTASPGWPTGRAKWFLPLPLRLQVRLQPRLQPPRHPQRLPQTLTALEDSGTTTCAARQAVAAVEAVDADRALAVETTAAQAVSRIQGRVTIMAHPV